MKSKFSKLIFAFLFAGISIQIQAAVTNPASVYTQKPEDTGAFYFTPENYAFENDGKTDVSEALQKAINQVKTEKNFGILFIPEGKYKISKTIYIPPAVRLIGYGTTRPEIILGKNSPGFQPETTGDKNQEKYMIWFTGGIVTDESQVRDANPGTFYSAVSNIDFTIEEGNQAAVALRTHYAQHGFVSHSVIKIGNGKAGISEVGNELENVQFLGGDYGIVTGPTSPSWPMMLVDMYFEGQRKAAMQCRNSGMAIVNMQVRNTPVVVEIAEGATDRLYFENCLFENISEAAIILDDRESTLMQINVVKTDCSDVPVLARFRKSERKISNKQKAYRVKEFAYGLVMNDLNDNSKFATVVDIEQLEQVSSSLKNDIPALPAMEKWVNIKELGAKGDGETDDTQVFQDAISKYEAIYVPQGWYRLTKTLKMKPGTKLIGLHPWATQFVLKESEPWFSGFGSPRAMIESSEGGDDQLNGIGISTGGYNYRAVGCKWMAGEKSYMNDVKFAGGHGTMRKPGATNENNRNRGNRGQISSPENPVHEEGLDKAWDNQYWSLWVTNNGGGTFKDIWTANTYATSGLFVSNTSTQARVYAISLEHHVRNEARFDNVSNWKLYAFQLEEEGVEGKECQMIEMADCKNILFANLWMYRVIRVTTPKRFGARLWNCENIEVRNLHNYTQKLWVTEFTFWDANKELPAYLWELAKLTVTGTETGTLKPENQVGKVERLISGFDFAQGITADSKGNVYFCETRKKRIYQWSAETQSAKILTDIPLQPFVLATDSKDNLLVVCRYDPQPGFLANGKQETVKRLPDDNPAYSSYGNGGWAALCYSIDPKNPEATFAPMKRVANQDIKNLNKTFYPASRWHYTFDKAAEYFPDSAFAAPDGVTFIQETYDIGRCAQLNAAVPGQAIYASDEISKRTVKMEVAANGKLSGLTEIFPRGETSTVVDKDGNLYLADGQIFVYDKNLVEINRINLPERPISMTFGGKDGHTLFVTTLTSLYGYRVK
ncbi:MAG TPA: gluconolaconase [Prolixibacteraceae bacterium]|nr:gluconolaconase [Prolixibacteraceae bacterium]